MEEKLGIIEEIEMEILRQQRRNEGKLNKNIENNYKENECG